MVGPSQPRAEPPRPGSGAMFDGIAERYDLVNKVMSLGGDRRWRRRTVRALALPPRARVLDLASGTADVAIEVLHQFPDAHVVGLDPSLAMLQVGRRKVTGAGLNTSIELTEGDAQEIPFSNGTFDGITMAFGIRNVPDRARALREMARVTKPGRSICILELGEPPQGFVGFAARLYVHHVVPRVGALLSSSHEYAYLQKSIEKFPPVADFARLMEESGIGVDEVVSFSFGACHLFAGRSAYGKAA